MSRQTADFLDGPHRVSPGAGSRERRGHVEIVFEGRRLTAREGDTVAAALAAHGIRVFGRSSKYHRPRGYRCGQGHCSACTMRVDGLPGVRTCVTTVRPGMRVEREHAWPTADVDLLRAAEALSPFLAAGSYYRWARRSPRLWGLLERTLARLAGQGALPDDDAARRLMQVPRERRGAPEVLVIGGGVAGMSAALAAHQAGAGVTLVERDDRLGGRLARARPGGDDLAVGDWQGDCARAAALEREILHRPGIETIIGAEAVGWYDDGLLAVVHGLDLLVLRPAGVVVATGGYDRGLPFSGWDLPGVMLAEGALRLLLRHDVVPGRRAVMLTTNDFGHLAAHRLAAGGIRIACIADLRRRAAVPAALMDVACDAGIPVMPGASAACAHGRRQVTALSLLADGSTRPRRVPCDLVCISAGSRPADDLARQATAHGPFTLAASGAPPPGQRLWLAGLASGACRADEACEQGRSAGAQAAAWARARGGSPA